MELMDVWNRKVVEGAGHGSLLFVKEDAEEVVSTHLLFIQGKV